MGSKLDVNYRLVNELLVGLRVQLWNSKIHFRRGGFKMKRLASLCFALALVIGTLFVPNSGSAKDKNPAVDKKAKQVHILERFQQNSKEKEHPMKLSWDQKKGIPNFVSGYLSNNPVKTKEAVLSFLQQNRDLFNLNAGDFEVNKVEKDWLGMTHYKTQLTVDGIHLPSF